MINFKRDGNIFNYRIAGVTIVDDKVLLHRLEKDNFWALPGGRCELLESSKDAIYREYIEEANIKVEVGEPLWILEMFFNHEGYRYHEISKLELYPTFLRNRLNDLPNTLEHIVHYDN